MDAKTQKDLHSDDFAVDRFATAMKAKLARSRQKGRGGWDDKTQCSGEHLANLLVEHLAKGNEGTLEDVANFAMMLHHRGESPELLSRIVRDQNQYIRGLELMSMPNEKNLVERLESAEATIKDAIQWLRDGELLDRETEDSANDAIQNVVKLRRACD